MTTEILLLESAVAGTATTAIALTANLEPLWTALIGFGVSLVTMVGGELVKFLVAYFKNKTNKYNKENKNDNDL